MDKLLTRARRVPPERQATTLDAPLLVSVPEAAHLLGIGLTFSWTLVRSGQLPAVRLGRRILVPRAAIEQLAHTASAVQDVEDSGGSGGSGGSGNKL